MSELEELGDEWSENAFIIASQKYVKRFLIKVRYDGNGNAIVRFAVERIGKSTIEYEKYDAAAGAYNRQP
jgi:hypothetical protein